MTADPRDAPDPRDLVDEEIRKVQARADETGEILRVEIVVNGHVAVTVEFEPEALVSARIKRFLADEPALRRVRTTTAVQGMYDDWPAGAEFDVMGDGPFGLEVRPVGQPSVRDIIPRAVVDIA